MYRKLNQYSALRGDVEKYLNDLAQKLNKEFKAIERSQETQERRIVEVQQVTSGTTPAGEVRTFRHIADKDGNIQFSALSDSSRLRFEVTDGVSIGFDSSTRKIIFGAVPGEIDHDQLLNYAANQHRVWENSIAQNIHANNITEASVTQHQAALSIAHIQLTYSGLTAGHVLRATGATAASFGTLTNAAFADNTIAHSRLVNISQNQILGRTATGVGPVSAVSITDGLHGSLGGGSLHALVTSSVHGFMSSTDKTKLDGIESGAQVNTVNSVFGRTGNVVAESNDYTWAQINKTISNIADIATRSHTSLTDIGTNTHAQIDTHIADTSIHFTSLTGLSDVTIGTLADNHLLQYNSVSGVFENKIVSHSTLADIGTNTHAQIDSHIVDGDIHFTQAQISIPFTQITGTITDAQHGNRGGGSLHALVTTSVHGFMSSGDKTKLDGVASGADNYNAWELKVNSEVTGVLIGSGLDVNFVEGSNITLIRTGREIQINSVTPPAVSELDDLSDVTIGTLANRHALLYNSTAGQWENRPAVLADISDSGVLAALNSVGTSQIDDNSVTYGKIQQASAGFTILAKATTGAGNYAELAAGSNSVLRRSGTGNLAFGTLVTGNIGNSQVTYAKIQNVSSTNRILGRISTGAGVIEELTATNVRTIINVEDGANNYTHPNHTGDVVSVGDGATTIQSGVVTYSKIQDVTADRMLGRLSTAGVVQELTSAQVLSFAGAEPAFSKGNLVQGTGVSLSGTLTNRLVDAGNVTVAFDEAYGDGRYGQLAAVNTWAQNNYFSGNVGIGTTSPSQELEVAGSIATTETLFYRPTSNDITLINYLGTTGAGDRFPRFDITTSADGTVSFNHMVSGRYSKQTVMELSGSGGDKVGWMARSYGDPAGIHIESSRIELTTGALDTGSAPGEILFYTQPPSRSEVLGLERMRITNAGNVGIGTTSPGERLDVVGNIRISEDSQYQIGTRHALSLPVDGFHTVAGRAAGSSWTAWSAGTYYANDLVIHNGTFYRAKTTTTKEPGVDTGWEDDWTSLGAELRQSAFGYFAGRDNTGERQSAFGYAAGYLNTGDRQSAFGYFAGRDNTGDFQSAFGQEAGRDNTGDFQSAFGPWAGYLNTGDLQSAFGYYAGRDNTGDRQQAFGYVAGYLNQGDRQSAFGYWAGRGNTGGRQSAFGYVAGYLNQGHRVTGVGYEATRGNEGNDVVAIGYQAGLNNTAHNQFIVQQVNINAVPLIQGDFSTGNVGIGTTAPQRKLDIGGTGHISLLGDSVTTNSTAGLYWFTDARYGIYRESGVWTSPYPRLMIEWARGISLDTDGSGNNIVMANSGGNVGIGTTSPQERLHVNGRIKAGVDNAADSGHFEIARGVKSAFIDNDHNPHIYGTSGLGDFLLGDLVIQPRTSHADGRSVIFAGGKGGSSFETMRIDGDGNVGIGTTSPVGGLHIKKNVFRGMFVLDRSEDINTDGVFGITQTGTPANYVRFYFADTDGTSNAVDVMSMGKDGNVGIGTTSPGDRLHVAGGVRINDRFRFMSATAWGGDHALIALDAGAGKKLSFFNYHTSSGIMTLDGDTGNVGIGTTSAGGKLTINEPGSDTVGTNVALRIQTDVDRAFAFRQGGTGNRDLHLDRLWGGSWSHVLTVQRNTGNVGINTPSPAERLHVEGFARTSSGYKVGTTTVIDSSRNITAETGTFNNLMSSGALPSDTIRFRMVHSWGLTQNDTSGIDVAVSQADVGQTTYGVKSVATLSPEVLSHAVYIGVYGEAFEPDTPGGLGTIHGIYGKGVSGSPAFAGTFEGNVRVFHPTANSIFDVNRTAATSSNLRIQAVSGATELRSQATPGSSTSRNLDFYTGNTFRMRLTSAGRLLINNTSTSTSFQLRVAGHVGPHTTGYNLGGADTAERWANVYANQYHAQGSSGVNVSRTWLDSNTLQEHTVVVTGGIITSWVVAQT